MYVYRAQFLLGPLYLIAAGRNLSNRIDAHLPANRTVHCYLHVPSTSERGIKSRKDFCISREERFISSSPIFTQPSLFNCTDRLDETGRFLFRASTHLAAIYSSIGLLIFIRSRHRPANAKKKILIKKTRKNFVFFAKK